MVRKRATLLRSSETLGQRSGPSVPNTATADQMEHRAMAARNIAKAAARLRKAAKDYADAQSGLAEALTEGRKTGIGIRDLSLLTEGAASKQTVYRWVDLGHVPHRARNGQH